MTDDTMITDSERDLLRFPAHADGLLRRGSPVWMQWLPAAVGPVALCAPHCDSNGEMCVCVSDGGASQLLSLVSLDLTDATGRAHLAWWMAHNVTRHQMRADVPTLAEAPMFGSYALRHSGDFILAGREHNCQRLWRWRGRQGVVTMVGELPIVPALADLNPDDPRLLPDGSRLVDALALSLVGRHLLAGGGR